ncbi:MAG: hypothetical protein HGA22_13375 [Clostridiales bacterium]|nr:hypothetical protein [Clostridiales bacterium]
MTEASGKLASLVQDYKELSYEYEKPEKVSGAKDPRGISIGAAETLLQLVSEEDVNYLNEGIAADELPSGADSPDETEKLDADLYDGESSFQGNALGLAGTIGGFSEADPADLRDNLYLNEYIMGTFKNAVPGDKGFDGHEKSEKDTFYNYEAEYILHGNASQNINKNLVTAELLALRFALDTLHVYTDSRKRELAAGIAAATAGWWTGGAGIPVVSNLIMCGWGLGEAVIDTSDLLKGERVPLFKSKGDWKLDIGIASEGEKKSGDLFAMGYYDYLRVFLLITPEEKKLERMQDLIQLNLGTEQENASVACFNTCIRVEAIISVNSLFLNSGFIPEDIRGYGLNAAGGRKKIRIVYLKGY